MFKPFKKEFNLFYLILLFIFLMSFLATFAQTEIDTLLPEEKYDMVNSSDEGSNYENFYNEPEKVTKRKIKYRKRNLEVNDKAFLPSKQLTFNDLLVRVSLIVLFLLVALFIIKIALSRNSFSRPGSFLDNLAHKLQDTFSPTSGIKLKQTLILTPGQNLYVVEIEDKKLLLGGTHQGGVQFLADLTQLKNSELLDFRKIEEMQHQATSKQVSPFIFSNQNQPINIAAESHQQQALSEEQLPSQGIAQMKQPLKRRTNFRQSLLSSK